MNQAQALLQAHFDTFVAQPEKWKSLISDDIVWELPYAPGLGHPTRLSGRDEVLEHVGWFIAAVQDFRFYDLQIDAFADHSKAVAQVKAEGIIKTTGESTGRTTFCSSKPSTASSGLSANTSIRSRQPMRWTNRSSCRPDEKRLMRRVFMACVQGVRHLY